jgi:hypothetical protein
MNNGQCTMDNGQLTMNNEQLTMNNVAKQAYLKKKSVQSVAIYVMRIHLMINQLRCYSNNNKCASFFMCTFFANL